MNYGIITVDTESHVGQNPVDRLIWGRLSDGSQAGIDLIMDIAERFKTKALFFLDFAEAWDYGFDAIKEVALHINERGHFIGVHIHPDHMADKERKFLWEYSEEEQYDLISRCTILYYEILGRRPISFRAGKYSADNKTLQIISKLGYKYDFSEFYGQKWCGIDPPITADRICKHDNIIEIPVTVFKSSDTFLLKRYDKLDMEMAHDQYRFVLDSLSKGNDNIVSLFLHSFSLMKWRKHPDKPVINKINLNKYQKCLKEVSENDNFIFLDEKQLDCLISDGTIEVPLKGNKEPQVKIKGLIRAYWFLLETSFRIAEHNPKARLFISLHIFVLIIIIVVLFTILK